MRNATAFALIVLLGGCSSDDTPAPGSDSGARPDLTAADVRLHDDSVGADAAADADDSFCALADCSADQPQCSELLRRCVECTANSDCSTAPLLSCETVGSNGDDPTFACVECVDDAVCAGGTCDLTSFTCVP